MRSARRAALLPVAVAVGGVLLASAPADAAVSASWTKPTDNSTYTTTAPIEFAVSLNRTNGSVFADGAAVYLNLAVPGAQPGPYRVDTSSGTSDRDLKFTFTPACENVTAACTGDKPAYNGHYTASLSGGASGSRTVLVQIPPAAPTGVAATATGQRRVKVSWAANREPDLTGYDVYTSDGMIVVEHLPADRTSYEFELPSAGYGGDHSYLVRARRLACGNCTGSDGTTQLTSAMTQSNTVTLNEPTPAPDSGTGGSGGGTGGSGGSGGTGGTGGTGGSGGSGGGYNGGDGGTGGTGGYNGGGSGGTGSGGSGSGGSGGGTAPQTDENGYSSGNNGGTFTSGDKPDAVLARQQQRLAFGLTFKSFSPKLGAPKLPPQPKFADPANAPIPEGTYDPMLGYGDQSILVNEPVATGGGVTETLVESVSSVFEGRRLFRSIAVALLLLLAAGHLRLWLRTTPE